MDVGSPWPWVGSAACCAVPCHDVPVHAMLCHGLPWPAMPCHAMRLCLLCSAPALSPLQDASCLGTGYQSIPVLIRLPRQPPDDEARPRCCRRGALGSPAQANSEELIHLQLSTSPSLLLLQEAEPCVLSAFACPCLCLICLILGCFIGKPTKYQTYSYSARDTQR